MSDKDVQVGGKLVSPNILMGGVLESPIAMFSRPWASVERYDSPPWKLDARGVVFEIGKAFPVKLGFVLRLEENVMIPSYEDLVWVGQRLQPVQRCLNFLNTPRLRHVASVDEEIAIRYTGLGVVGV